MKEEIGSSVGNRIFGLLLTAAAGCACVYNLLVPYTSGDFLQKQLPFMMLFSAAVLFLPGLFRKAAKFAWAVPPVLALWGLYCLGAGDFSTAAGILFQTPEQVVDALLVSQWGLPAASCAVAALVFLCRKRRTAALLYWAVNIALPTMLYLRGYPVSVPALTAATACTALLFVRAGVQSAAAGKAGAEKAGLRASVIAALACAVLLTGVQFAYTGLQKVFQDQPKIDIMEMAAKFNKSLFTKSGFDDYDPNRVLGRYTQLDSTPVMTVQADGPLYLRGRIYDTYTGKSWQVSGAAMTNPMREGDDRSIPILAQYENSVLMVYANNILGKRKLSYLDLGKAESPVHICNATITVEEDQQKYLFVPAEWGSLIKLSFQSQYPSNILKTPLIRGQNVTIEYLDRNYKSKAYDMLDEMNEKSSSVQLEQSKKQALEVMRSLFGSTENITPRTKALAQEITKGMTDERQKAGAILKWLQQNCTYTLTPPQPWPGRDFADSFLFDSRRGYCEHFATAMAVLLRASGVPARYIEGYAVPSATYSSKMHFYKITNEQAHAWVEYYSSRYGFITADPTPGGSLTKPEMLFEPKAAPSTASLPPVSSSGTSKAPSTLSGASMPSASVSSASSGASDMQPGGAALALLFAFLKAAGVILAAVLLLWGGRVGYRALWFRVIWHRDGRRMPLALYRHFVRVFYRLGFDVPASSTPNELAAEVRRKIMFEPVSFDRITELYCSVRYGGHVLTESERAEWLTFYRAMPGICRKKFGRLRCFVSLF